MTVLIPGMYGGDAADPTLLITRRITALGCKRKANTLFTTLQSAVKWSIRPSPYHTTTVVPCIICALPTNADKLSKTHHLTSIPHHSKTRNKLGSAARAESMPTMFVQNVAPSSAVARAAACSQSPMSPGPTPRKSIKTRVTTSGTGETRIFAACSYDACARKRSATYSCLSRSGSQYLTTPAQAQNFKKRETMKSREKTSR